MFPLHKHLMSSSWKTCISLPIKLFSVFTKSRPVTLAALQAHGTASDMWSYKLSRYSSSTESFLTVQLAVKAKVRNTLRYTSFMTWLSLSSLFCSPIMYSSTHPKWMHNISSYLTLCSRDITVSIPVIVVMSHNGPPKVTCPPEHNLCTASCIHPACVTEQGNFC